MKESDRIATMAKEPRAMGARIEERPDGMVIQGLGRQSATGALTGATYLKAMEIIASQCPSPSAR